MPRDLSLARLRSATPPGWGPVPDPVTSPTTPGRHRRPGFCGRAYRAAARGAALYAGAVCLTVSLALFRVYAALEVPRG